MSSIRGVAAAPGVVALALAVGGCTAPQGYQTYPAPSTPSAASCVVPDGATSEPLKDGKYQAYLIQAGDGCVTIARFRRLNGKAAAAACKADGVENQGFELCNDYYFDPIDEPNHTFAVAEEAKITQITGDPSKPQRVTWEHLSSFDPYLYDGGDSGTPFEITVGAGQVTVLAQVFTP